MSRHYSIDNSSNSDQLNDSDFNYEESISEFFNDNEYITCNTLKTFLDYIGWAEWQSPEELNVLWDVLSKYEDENGRLYQDGVKKGLSDFFSNQPEDDIARISMQITGKCNPRKSFMSMKWNENNIELLNKDLQEIDSEKLRKIKNIFILLKIGTKQEMMSNEIEMIIEKYPFYNVSIEDIVICLLKFSATPNSLTSDTNARFKINSNQYESTSRAMDNLINAYQEDVINHYNKKQLNADYYDESSTFEKSVELTINNEKEKEFYSEYITHKTNTHIEYFIKQIKFLCISTLLQVDNINLLYSKRWAELQEINEEYKELTMKYAESNETEREEKKINDLLAEIEFLEEEKEKNDKKISELIQELNNKELNQQSFTQVIANNEEWIESLKDKIISWKEDNLQLKKNYEQGVEAVLKKIKTEEEANIKRHNNNPPKIITEDVWPTIQVEDLATVSVLISEKQKKVKEMPYDKWVAYSMKWDIDNQQLIQEKAGYDEEIKKLKFIIESNKKEIEDKKKENIALKTDNSKLNNKVNDWVNDLETNKMFRPSNAYVLANRISRISKMEPNNQLNYQITKNKGNRVKNLASKIVTIRNDQGNTNKIESNFNVIDETEEKEGYDWGNNNELFFSNTKHKKQALSGNMNIINFNDTSTIKKDEQKVKTEIVIPKKNLDYFGETKSKRKSKNKSISMKQSAFGRKSQNDLMDGKIQLLDEAGNKERRIKKTITGINEDIKEQLLDFDNEKAEEIKQNPNRINNAIQSTKISGNNKLEIKTNDTSENNEAKSFKNWTPKAEKKWRLSTNQEVVADSSNTNPTIKNEYNPAHTVPNSPNNIEDENLSSCLIPTNKLSPVDIKVQIQKSYDHCSFKNYKILSDFLDNEQITSYNSYDLYSDIALEINPQTWKITNLFWLMINEKLYLLRLNPQGEIIQFLKYENLISVNIPEKNANIIVFRFTDKDWVLVSFRRFEIINYLKKFDNSKQFKKIKVTFQDPFKVKFSKVLIDLESKSLQWFPNLDNVIKIGFLFKSEGIIKSFNEKLVVLTTMGLLVYDDLKKRKIKKWIPIVNSTLNKSVIDIAKKLYVFEITTINKELHIFKARFEEEMNSWYDELLNVTLVYKEMLKQADLNTPAIPGKQGNNSKYQ